MFMKEGSRTMRNSVKEKKKRRLGVSGKMMIGVTVPIIAILIALAIIVSIVVVNIISDLKNTDVANQSDAISKQIPEYFETYFVSQEYIIDRPSIQQIFEELDESSSTFRFENSETYDAVMRDLQYADELAGSAGQSVWIAGMKNSELIQSDGYISDSSYEVTERAWYNSLLATNGRRALSPVYEDVATGKLVVTAVTPYFNDSGEMIGAVGIDLSMDELTAYLSEIAIGETGYVTVYDSDRNIVYHPDSSLVMTNMSEIAYSENMKELLENDKTSEVIKYQRGEQSFYGATFYVSEYAWSVLACMPEAEYIQETMLVISILIGGFLLCIVIAAVVCVFRTRKIVSPLKSIGAVAQEFAKGNLNSDIKRNTDDEIGDLEEVFAQTQDNLKAIISDIGHVLKEISQKNLDVDTSSTYLGDFAQIERSLKGITGRLNGIMSQIGVTAGQVDSGANQVSSGAQSLAQGATEQASSVEELSAMISEALQKTKQMANSSREASAKADNAGTVMEDSSQKMNLMLEAMDRINAEANEIQKIIKTIEDIAFQTNILALNAAVEAARAGVAGKGFAVVADEVRNLAAKSSDASKSTADMIVRALDAVKDGTVLARDAATTLSDAAVDVKDVVGRIGDVSNELTSHEEVMQTLAVGVDQISSVVQTNSATAEESAAASEEMSAQATVLKEIIHEFNLKPETN